MIRLPTVIKDPRTSGLLKLKEPIEQYEPDDGELFLAGPVGRRVATLDFDPTTGVLTDPVRFRPPTAARKLGDYEVKDLKDVHALDVMKVSVFATVLKTISPWSGAGGGSSSRATPRSGAGRPCGGRACSSRSTSSRSATTAATTAPRRPNSSTSFSR